MKLVNLGKSDFSIVVEPNNEAALFIATELQEYISRSTGVKLDIETEKGTKSGAFFIGKEKAFSVGKDVENALKTLRPLWDGFVCEVKSDKITLTAMTNRGLIYGGYRFLETFLGVRFYNLDCEVVPTTDSIEIDERLVVEEPAFAMRSYLNGKLYWKEGEEYRKFYLKMKQNNEHVSLNEEKYELAKASLEKYYAQRVARAEKEGI